MSALKAASAEQLQDIDLARCSAHLKTLAEFLNHCRQQHKTVTYLEAAEAVAVQGPHRIHQTTELLESLLEHDQQHDQPLRAALVVSRTQPGLPASGFFLKAQALGLMLTGTNEEFHQQCLKRLFDNPAVDTL